MHHWTIAYGNSTIYPKVWVVVAGYNRQKWNAECDVHNITCISLVLWYVLSPNILWNCQEWRGKLRIESRRELEDTEEYEQAYRVLKEISCII